MAKGDTPPFRMVVEKGPRLAPTNGSDAERLSTYRIGSEVNVVFIRNGSRVMERKWWAVLGLVVDRCNVPWKTKEQASEAVKLALGIVNLTRTVGGAWMQYPKSLTDLSDPELDDAVRDMMDLITKMTGIDIETLRRETADVGRDDNHEEQQVSDVPPTASDQGSGDSSSPVEDPAPTESAAADLQAPEEPSTPEESSGAGHTETTLEGSPDPLTRELMRECVDTFMSIATRTDAGIEAKRKQMANSLSAWRKEAIDRDFIEKCRDAAGRIVKKESTVEREREYLGRFIR